jgi:DHA2 family multidrug resistance protein
MSQTQGGSQGGAATDTPHRALITICLMIATLMQALDSTIANVALPYMQGTLSASYDQITWVLTSYVIAAAIMTAPVGWLTARFGRKNLFIACLVGFTVTSMLCGIAGSLSQMVVYRLLQGMFGAALVPLSQSTMLDIYPVEQRGSAMSIWGMGVMVGPILGPTLGGYLTFYYNWRFVFFVNLPFGIIAILGLLFLMPKVKQHKDGGFDWLGFSVLSIGLAGLQIALDRGEELDWFSSPTIIISAIAAGLGFYLFVVHLLTAKNPFIPRAAFGDLNFNAGLITMFSVGIVLLASSALLAPYLENLGNYPVESAGLIMAPRGAGTMLAMLIAGRLTNRIDPRLLMFFGYILLAASMVMLEGWTPDVSESYMMITIVIQGAGLGFVFVPLQVVAFYTLSPALRTQGTALLSLVRNVGSAIGISVTSALLDHMSQYEHANLAQFITPFERPLQAGGAVTKMLDPTTPGGASLLNTMIDTQAQIIGYIDDYKLMLITTIPAVACLFLMRRPKTATAPAPAHAVMD